MIRRIVKIDESKCNGCGLCAKACHEGAIGIIEGKAKLLRDDYCDGLGDCLPACPMNAIAFEEREAADYDEAAVLAAKREREAAANAASSGRAVSRLTNFPVQIKLAAPKAAYFDGADLLIAADCCAYACGSFHEDYIKGRVTLIGCTKLDGVNYAEKLSQILSLNDIKSITVARMTVPCCGGLPLAVKTAVKLSGKDIPVNIVTIDPKGNVV